MKRMKRIPLLLTLAAALCAAASCVENPGIGGTVNFGASMGGFLTKTEYAGSLTGSPGNYTESIYWVNGDKIKILCEQTNDRHELSYSVTPGSDKTKASKVTPDGGKGLQWGTGTHYFHASYPSASHVSHTLATSPANSSIFSAEIPGAQSGTAWSSNEYGPAMNQYAYMYATASYAADSPTVLLSFKPLMTAFRFSIKSDPSDPIPAGTKLTKVELSSAVSDMAGEFTVVIGSDGTFLSGTPTIASGATKSVSLSLGSGVALSTTTACAFTLFALPVKQEQLTLKLTFHDGTDETTRSLALKNNNNWISVEASSKLRIDGLAVTPSGFTGGTSPYNPGSDPGLGDADFSYTVLPAERTIRTGESFTLSASSMATPPLRPDDFTYDVNVTTGVNPITLDPLSATSNAKSWTVTGNTPGQVVVTVKATRGSIVKEKTCTVTVVAESSTEGYGVGTGSGF